MTVSKTKSGKFFVSIQCREDVTPPPAVGSEVGIDLGLKAFATLSDGRIMKPPQHLWKAERRLKRLQRRLSRKRKGSANRRKAKVLLARQHEKVANRAPTSCTNSAVSWSTPTVTSGLKICM